MKNWLGTLPNAEIQGPTIINRVRVKLRFWDRVRFLFNGNMAVVTEIGLHSKVDQRLWCTWSKVFLGNCKQAATMTFWKPGCVVEPTTPTPTPPNVP